MGLTGIDSRICGHTGVPGVVRLPVNLNLQQTILTGESNYAMAA
jgi:hypothetical protein